MTASGDSKHFRPTLTVDVLLEDDVVVDASLTPASRNFFSKIASEVERGQRRTSIDTTSTGSGSGSGSGSNTPPEEGVEEATTAAGTNTLAAADAEDSHKCAGGKCRHETIELPLVFDNEFFEMLQSDVNNIDSLQNSERKNMNEEITALGNELAQVAKPRRLHKTDMDSWRNIFELYLDAEVFFATHEQEHGARSSQAATKKLQWFQSEITKRDLVKTFKIPQSKVAFTRFLQLNSDLLKMLQFQELNQLAVHKILKSK